MTERRIRLLSLSTGILVYVVLGFGFILALDACGITPPRGLAMAVINLIILAISAAACGRMRGWLARRNPPVGLKQRPCKMIAHVRYRNLDNPTAPRG